MKSVLSLLTDPVWHQALSERVKIETLLSLNNFLNAELAFGKKIYPPQNNWFRALNELALNDVRVVILGQDPYHGPEQAQGLSFSVAANKKLPPSLRNIFKEIQSDLGITVEGGDLSPWLEQGVMLLNAVLTVESGKAGSHAKKGWEPITDSVISIINEQLDSVVFLLWGSYAQSKRVLIDEQKHLILLAAHPSPLSAYRGWFGCQHFSKTNEFLRIKGRAPIDWNTTIVSQIPLL